MILFTLAVFLLFLCLTDSPSSWDRLLVQPVFILVVHKKAFPPQ